MAAALLSLVDCCQECDCTSTVVDGGTGGGTGTVVGFFTVKSIAEAQLIPWATTNQAVFVNGNEDGGDGNLGSYTWNELSTALDTGAGADVIEPFDHAGRPGRWKRLS